MKKKEEIEEIEQETPMNEEPMIKIKNLSSPFRSIKKMEFMKFRIDDFTPIIFPGGSKGIIACCSDKTLRFFQDEKCTKSVKHEVFIRSLLFVKKEPIERSLLLTTGSYGEFIIWEVFPELREIQRKQVAPVGEVLFGLTNLSPLRTSTEYPRYICGVYSTLRTNAASIGAMFKITHKERENEVVVEGFNYPIMNGSVGLERVECIHHFGDKLLFAGGEFDNGNDFTVKMIITGFTDRFRRFPKAHSATVKCLTSFYNKNEQVRIISGGYDKKLVVWSEYGGFVYMMKLDEPIQKVLVLGRSVQSRKKSFSIVTGSIRGVPKLYSLSLDSRKLELISSNFHNGRVEVMKWNSSETGILTCSEHGDICAIKIHPEYMPPLSVENSEEKEEKEEITVTEEKTEETLLAVQNLEFENNILSEDLKVLEMVLKGREEKLLSFPFQIKKAISVHSEAIYGFTTVRFFGGKKMFYIFSSENHLRFYNEEFICEKVIGYIFFNGPVHFYEEQSVLLAAADKEILVISLVPEIRIVKRIDSKQIINRMIKLSKTEFFCASYIEGYIFTMEYVEKDDEYIVKEIEYPPLPPEVEENEEENENENENDENDEDEYEFISEAIQLRSQEKVILFSGGNYHLGRDFSLKKYDLKKKEFFRFPILHTDTVCSLCSFFNEKNEELVISSSHDRKMMIWNLEGKVLNEVKFDPCETFLYDRKRNSVLFSACSKLSERSIYAYSIKTQEIQKVVTGVHDDSIMSMNWIDEEKQNEFVTCAMDGTSSAKFVIFGLKEYSHTYQSNNPVIKRLTAPLRFSKTFNSFFSAVYDFTIVPSPYDEKRLALCSDDETIRFFSEDKCELVVKHTASINSIHYFKEKNLLLTTDSNGELVIWNMVPEITVKEKIKICGAFTMLWKLIQISRNEFVCGSERRDQGGGLYKITIGVDNNNNKIKVEDVEIPEDEENELREGVRALYQLKSEEKTIVFAGHSPTNEVHCVKKYDFKNKEYTRFKKDEHSSGIECIGSFLNEENIELVLSCSYDNRVIIWELDGKPLHVLDKLGFVEQLVYDSWRKRFIFVYEDKTSFNLSTFCVRTHRAQTVATNIHKVRNGIVSIGWLDENQNTLVTCSDDESFNIFEFETGIEEKDLKERKILLFSGLLVDHKKREGLVKEIKLINCKIENIPLIFLV